MPHLAAGLAQLGKCYIKIILQIICLSLCEKDFSFKYIYINYCLLFGFGACIRLSFILAGPVFFSGGGAVV